MGGPDEFKAKIINELSPIFLRCLKWRLFLFCLTGAEAAQKTLITIIGRNSHSLIENI